MTIEKGFFRQVMGRFATGVTVVTTENQGQLAGLTVNAFTSVSLDPPLVLICIEQSSNTIPLLRESQKFAVNILTEQQEDLSRCFASSGSNRYKNFCNASYRKVATGAPVIENVLAFIDAKVVAEYPGGDHVIFLGQVEAMGTGDQTVFADDTERVYEPALEPRKQHNGSSGVEEIDPMVFYRGKYRQLSEQYQAPSLNPPQVGHIEEPTRG